MNFLEDHFSRELGALPLRKWQLRKSIWHQSHQMLRHVVLSKHRKFKKLPVLVSNGQVLYEDGKLFLAHKGTSAMDCHFLREGGRGCDNLSKALRLRYSIPLKPTWKDQETWLGPINDERGRPELKNDSLKPSLFVLREDKTLTRYDLRTGQILESHFLFSTRKFTELRLNAGNPNVLVKSTKLSGFCQETACQHTNCNRICFSFIAFSYPSLKFQAHLEVSETIFKNLYNAVISDGILIIINSKKTAKLYDFNHIMQENMTKSLKIGDKVGTDIVGQYPLGFPINVVIREEPSVLFQVHCQDYDIGFSSFFPPLCVTTAKDYCYKVYDMDLTQRLSIRRIGYEDGNDVNFHPDDSRRLIHLAESRLLLYQVEELQQCKLAFEFNADPDPKETSSNDSSSDDEYNPAGYEVVYCYENELDILAVLCAESITPDQEEYGDFYTRIKLHRVELFDNKSYAKLKSIPLDHCIKLGSTESPQLSLDLDRDVLLVRVKSSAKTRTLVWRLLYEDNNVEKPEENGVPSKSKTSEKRLRNKRHQTNDTITLRPTRTSSRRKSKNA